MESAGLICLKFVKYMSRRDTRLDELILPEDFCSRYLERLEENFFLNLRNGYELPVSLDFRLRKIKGLSTLFRDFNLRGGEVLVFEYYGRRDFNVYIIGSDLGEICYPAIVHSSQKCRPRSAGVAKYGWKFIVFINRSETLTDRIEIPASFVERCTVQLEDYMKIVLSNGQKFDVIYDRESRVLSGLSKVSSELQLGDLNEYPVLVFTFDGICQLILSPFTDDFVEHCFAGTPLGNGFRGTELDIAYHFEILIQPFHLYDYCHGVDISTKYKDLCFWWFKTDFIHVYNGSSAWRLQVRRRDDMRRTTIHNGWIPLKLALNLKVGNLLRFECPADSWDHFRVTVQR